MSAGRSVKAREHFTARGARLYPRSGAVLDGLNFRKHRLEIPRERIERQADRVQMFFRNRHNVQTFGNRLAVKPEEFPQKSFHPVADHGVSRFLAHSQPDSPMGGRAWLGEHKKEKAL